MFIKTIIFFYVVGMNNSIDEKDIQILRGLRKNARKPVTEIAESVGLHPNTVLQRISRMEKTGVIRGYTVDIDFQKTGYGFQVLVMMKLLVGKYAHSRDFTQEMSIPEVEALYRITGESDWAAIIRTKNQEQFSGIINEILSKDQVHTVSHLILNTEKHPFSYNPFTTRRKIPL